MTLTEVEYLVRQGETETIEFKTKANHPEKIVREMVAFANTRGGKLLVGVNDQGKITGLATADEELYMLESAIAKYCFPKFDYQYEIIAVSAKKSIIIYTIFESSLKPHFALLDQSVKQRKGYIRVADRSVQASKEMKEILRRERKKTAMRFTYGEKEKVLMNYLERHEFITLKIFSKLAGIRPYLASRTLITLVLAKVLQIIPREGEDWYRFNTLSV